MAALLDIRLLGPPEMLVDGAPAAVDTRKALAIVALIATDGRAYARSELAAMLWPEADDESARGALRRTLSTLRSAVGAETLVIDRTKVGLDDSRIRVDLRDLERAVGSRSLSELTAAAALARGPYLAGFGLRDSPAFDDWRAGRAMGVERTVATVLDGLSLASEAAGDLVGARRAAAQRVQLDPLDERAHVRLMDVLAAGGDRAGALRQYRACIATLDRELGVGPLPETTARYEAIRDAVSPPSARPTAVPIVAAHEARLPMVGRDGLMEAIARTHASASTDGRVVVLVGEAGIGKTRLAEAATAEVQALGGSIIAARAYAAERAIAYGLIVELLRAGLADPERRRLLSAGVLAEIGRLLPDVEGRRRPAPASESSAGQARLVAAVADALTALGGGPTPGALWIDDAQWADAASLEALAYLLRRLPAKRLLIVFTWRREDLEGDQLGFAEMVESLPGTTTLSLDRLDREAIGALAMAASGGIKPGPGVIDELLLASEGLPLYIVEALAAGARPGEMPIGVRAVLRQRLSTVDGVARQVVTAAALIGRSFDLAIVRHASGRSDDETVAGLDELVRRGLIRELPTTGRSGVRYDFAHAALRDLSEESTSLARRRLIHRRIAEAIRLDLAGTGRDDLGRLVQVAQHERDAGRDPEAAAAYHEAADRAVSIYANREAIDLYQWAAALGHPDVVGIHAAVGALQTRLGDYVGAIASLEAAAALAGRAGQAPLELALARAHVRRGDLVAADRHLDAGLAVVDDPQLMAQMLVTRSIVKRRAGEISGAEIAAADALAIATGQSDSASVGSANRMLGLIALDRGDPHAARAALELARLASRSDPDPTAAIAADVGLAMAEAALGRLDVMLEHGESALATCRLVGDRHLEAAVENHIADLLHAGGRDEAALEHLRRAVEAFAEVGGDPADPDPGIWMLAAW
jgi:DNA-binding SARP family transcriptional activator/tetratricopeptide (TPR) repeat protein